MRYLILLLSLLSALALSIYLKGPDPTVRMNDLPHIFLWAWERPDDMRDLPPDVGVAYLAATLRVDGDRVLTVPRRQPIRLPKNCALISVIRIEVKERPEPELSDKCIHELCKMILKYSNLPRAKAVQIDFDARQSERQFYSRLLSNLRATLPAGCPISITALASWCMCDNWMQKLPIEESVPMLFSMAQQTNNIVNTIEMDRPFGDKRCDRSLGISLDEPEVNLPALQYFRRRNHEHAGRIYIFSSRTWSAQSVLEALQLVRGQVGSVK